MLKQKQFQPQLQTTQQLKPQTQDPDRKRASEILFGSDAPIIKSVGYAKLPGTREYCAYVVTIQGKEIIDISLGIPNMKGIVEEEAKISFIRDVMDMDT